MGRYYSYEEVKGLKRYLEEDIEAGERYCIPLPRHVGGDWNEQRYDIAVADKPIPKSGVRFTPYCGNVVGQGIDKSDFSPKAGVMKRYSIVDNLLKDK